MILDYFMVVLAGSMLAFAFAARSGAAVAGLMLFSLVSNLFLLELLDMSTRVYFYNSAPLWLTLFFLKDILIWLTLGIRNKSIELTLFLSFIASSLFHQAALYQVLNRSAELLSYRPAFMTYLTAIQLASVIYIIIKGSTWNGGKRVANTWFNMLHNSINRFFYIQAYKVKK